MKNTSRLDSDVKHWLDVLLKENTSKKEEKTQENKVPPIEKQKSDGNNFQVKVTGVSEFRKKHFLPKLDELEEDS